MTPGWQFGSIRGGDAPPPASIIVKIGGSLLARPGWPAALATLLDGINQPLLVVGGGSVVDGLRAIDRASPRPAALMHDLAIRGMTLTARLVADALNLPLVNVPTAPYPAVLDVAAWLDVADPPPDLPAGWDVTSDSLAAAAAVAGHHGLLLVKSVPPRDRAASLQSLAAAGWIDAHFEAAAAPLATIAWAAPSPAFDDS